MNKREAFIEQEVSLHRLARHRFVSDRYEPGCVSASEMCNDMIMVLWDGVARKVATQMAVEMDKNYEIQRTK